VRVTLNCQTEKEIFSVLRALGGSIFSHVLAPSRFWLFIFHSRPQRNDKTKVSDLVAGAYIETNHVSVRAFSVHLRRRVGRAATAVAAFGTKDGCRRLPAVSGNNPRE
jgi:hypothetical protein